MRRWRMMAFHGRDRSDQMHEALRGAGLIAIGWGEVGDLRRMGPVDEEGVLESVRELSLDMGPSNSRNGARSLLRLFREIRVGDQVRVHSRLGKDVFEITGEYYWEQGRLGPSTDYWHRRRARLLHSHEIGRPWGRRVPHGGSVYETIIPWSE